MRVGVASGQHIFVAGKRIKKVPVEHVVQRQLLEFVPASELIRRRTDFPA